VEDLRKQAGGQVVKDLAHGSEAYLEMWERAVGVPSARCLAARTPFSARGFGHRLRLGETTTQALFSAGQPLGRPGRSFRYCVAGSRSRHVSAVFNRRGRLVLIASNAGGGRVRYVAAPSERHNAAGLRADLRAAGF
jgi:hypothetical protein